MGAYYCAICRQTTFNGKGHIFGKNHQSRLRVVLLKFLDKVSRSTRIHTDAPQFLSILCAIFF